MWIFSRYGFYSIACGSKADGSVDSQTMMVRARRADHLRELKSRFPALAELELIALRNRDYRYRIIVPKPVWMTVLAGLAEEQEWSNFKQEVAAQNRKNDADYIHALHAVWKLMLNLQAR